MASLQSTSARITWCNFLISVSEQSLTLSAAQQEPFDTIRDTAINLSNLFDFIRENTHFNNLLMTHNHPVLIDNDIKVLLPYKMMYSLERVKERATV